MKHEPLKTMVGVKTKTIWAAYQEALEELKGVEEVKSTESIAEDKKRAEALSVANEIDVLSITDMLEKLKSGIVQASDTFKSMQEALKAKEQELKDVHNLEFEANALVATVTAKQRLVDSYEQKANVLLEEAKEKKKQIIEEANKEAESILTKMNETIEARSTEEERRVEEWEYQSKRRERKALDELQDKLDKHSKSLNAREQAIEEREAKMGTLEDRVAELENELRTVEAQVDNRIVKAVEGVERRLHIEHQKEIAILETKYEAKLAISESSANNLAQQLQDYKDRAEKAAEQITAANERVALIATTSLKAGADAATVAKVSEIAAGSSQKK